MDFKKFASDASTMFSRAKQYTEEKLGQAEKTEYDAQFESLLLRAERTQYWTEKFINQTETVLIPDPATRVEARLMDKLEHKKREKPTPIEILGQDMTDAANQLGPGTSYGATLIKVGETERMIGIAERDLMDAASTSYLHPLKAFLDNDMKAYAKERKVLENARLDLDSCKSRVKKITKQANKEPAEFELRQAQAVFDRQVEVVRLLLEGITATQGQHQRCLQDFVAEQTAHYARCHQYLVDLQSHLTGSIVGNVSSVGEGGVTKVTRTGGGGFSLLCAANSLSMDGDSVPYTVAENGASDTLQARALHDYHAGDMRELSLAANEELVVFKLSDDSSAAMFVAQRGAQQGTVPKNCVQLLS